MDFVPYFAICFILLGIVSSLQEPKNEKIAGKTGEKTIIHAESVFSVRESYFEFNYCGSVKELFKIKAINFFACLFSLGALIPWAKARTFRYLYSHIELDGSRFRFTATTRQLARGYSIALAVYGLSLIVTAVIAFIPLAHISLIIVREGLIFSYWCFLFFYSFFSSRKFRAAHCQFRGIFFQLKLNPLKEAFYATIRLPLLPLSLGIYTPFFLFYLHKRRYSALYYGDQAFEFSASSDGYAERWFKGFFLCLASVGLYSFSMAAKLWNYRLNNLSIKNNQVQVFLNGWTITKWLIGNSLIWVLSLGLADAWTTTRRLRLLLGKAGIKGSLLVTVNQAEQQSTEAAGEMLYPFARPFGGMGL